jgi:polyketide synthase PksN
MSTSTMQNQGIIDTFQTIQNSIRNSLGLELDMNPEEINDQTPFSEIGLDSINAVSWMRKINSEYALSLTATKTYDYPNLHEFTEFLTTELAKRTGGKLTEPNNSAKEQPKIPPPKMLSKGLGTTESTPPKKPIKLGDTFGLVLTEPHQWHQLALSDWRVAEPLAHEVTIKVFASAISFTDTICVKGLYPIEYPFVPGFDVSGVVSAVGDQVTAVSVGDPVIALTGPQMGGHASHVNVPETHVVAKPDFISFEEACSLPFVFGTAYYALEELGKLSPKEHVLIHTATGGCGLIALQLAWLKGAVCYVTAGKPEKVDYLKRLEVPYVINYRTTRFDQTIQRITQNRGVDIVLNMLSGDAIQNGLNCLAPSGRYVELSSHGLLTAPKLDISKLRFNQSIQTLFFHGLLCNGQLAQEILQLMVSWLESERIVPIVSRIYPIHQIVEALELVSQGNHIGKVVISHTQQTPTVLTDKCLERLLEQKQKAEMYQGVQSSQLPVTPQPATRAPKKEKNREVVEEIAVIGMAGKFPQSANLFEFWEAIASGKNCITEIPAKRWSINEYYDPNPTTPGKTNSKWMGCLDDADQFDPLFFNISPREAEIMDPQHRIFLESAWRCIEDAGIPPDSLSNSRCGVFVGCGSNDYYMLNQHDSKGVIGATGGAPSILPARVSYFLNLKGPSVAVDTACSASLVAVAQACDSLILNNCDLALAGGVLVMPGPLFHVGLGQGGMLSKDGQCFTFDARANGFVPGEGVGTVLLKRLSDAQRDGDQIYAVIKGWGINQDGKTNGITAPSGKAQTALEKEVFERFSINPETITLVEAHGTGTILGDPIEVEALTESFRAFTQKQNYCALGSVKTNIGHLGQGAGIVGLIKVLLALRNKQLPPTINFNTLNPNLSLETSPFYVNTSLKPWETEENLPRCASVSSFGFSGTNAFMVVEEGAKPDQAVEATPPWIVPLSAKNADQLRDAVEQLYQFITTESGAPEQTLSNIAYTLQVGRVAMEERVVFLVTDQSDLIKKLRDFLDGEINGCLIRSIKRSNDALTTLLMDEDMDDIITKWVKKRKYTELMKLWVNGFAFDWNRLYPTHKPNRISLPTYPFAKEQYWISNNISVEKTARLHPLLHKNSSTDSEQCFTSTFTGTEFFLTDHEVNGQKVFPGVGYLEMARAAVEHLPVDTDFQLKQVVWAQPIIVDAEARDVFIKLVPQDEIKGTLKYTIYSKSEAGDVVFHSQGSVVFAPNGPSSQINLEKIRSQMTREPLTFDQIYQAFSSVGFHYGPGHQGIQTLYRGDNQVLAKLSLPPSMVNIYNDYVLHPGLMDSALQASIGLRLDPAMLSENNTVAQSEPARLPFALESLEILKPCPTEMYSWLRVRSPEQGAVQKLDVDICDLEGNVCVKIRGISVRMRYEKTDQFEEALPTPDNRQSIQKRDSKELLTKTYQALIQTVSRLQKIEPEKIDLETKLPDYGFDSLIFTELANQLNGQFDLELMPTVFFEHVNLSQLGEYLVNNYGEKLQKVLYPPQSVPDIQLMTEPVIHPQPAVKNTVPPKTSEPVAVIGIACRFPGSANCEEFWHHLEANHDLITEIPKERWIWQDYYGDPRKEPGKINVKEGGFIDGPDRFDARFFEISPIEAETMDPQLRLSMETAWTCIEDAGYQASSLAGSNTGVYFGISSTSDYRDLCQQQHINQGMITVFSCMTPNRLSYFFGFHGPSLAIDTACSSSLIALHRAVGDIRANQCDMALVGGVNLMLNPAMTAGLNQTGMLSADSRCRTFDKRANGYVRGEGVGVILLKPLSAAIQDGDHIYGTIIGSAENHGGKATSPTAPNPTAQKQLLIDAYISAGISPDTVTYIEAHGTGTELGDPIEFNALKGAFEELYKRFQLPTPDQPSCAIGAVKTNIGHLEAAAGISGVIKTLLMIKHQKIAGNVHLQEVNPYLKLEHSPFYLTKATHAWKSIQGNDGNSLPRRAGVSSFGVGGANAHVVLEEYLPATQPVDATEQPVLIPFSAKQQDRLVEYIENFRHFLETARLTAKPTLKEIAYTLQVGREPMPHRVVFLVSTVSELLEGIKNFQQNQHTNNCWQGHVKKPVGETDLKTNEELEQNNLLIDCHFDDRRNLIDAKDFSYRRNDKQGYDQTKLEKIARVWVNGGNVDWNQLYGETKPARVSLVTYPFAKTSHWLLKPVSQPGQITPSWDGVSYQVKWERVTNPTTVPTHTSVLIVCYQSQFKFETAILDYYKRNPSVHVRIIRLGDHTRQLSDTEWMCGIEDQTGFETCLQTMTTIDGLFFLSMQQSEAITAEGLVFAQEKHEIQLLRLIKYLKRSGKIRQHVDTYLITLNNYSLGDQNVYPYGAGVTGLGYAIAQGNYQFLVRNIDLSSSDLTNQELISAILNEPASNRGEVFKFEGGNRYRQTVFRLMLEAPSGIRQQGVYVILGGRGRVGQIISRYLIQNYHATVVWIGRSPKEAESVQTALGQFTELEHSPVYVQADVTDINSIKRAVVSVKAAFSQIHGAIFSGLVFSLENSIEQTTETEFKDILTIKTLGSLNFFSAFENEPLDFMCYFSSGQAYSFSGASKFSAYATGITYSDALVKSFQKQSKFPIGIINWGFWKPQADEGLSSQTGDVLEHQLGCFCFDKFVSGIQHGQIDQILCIKTSPTIESLMNLGDTSKTPQVVPEPATTVPPNEDTTEPLPPVSVPKISVEAFVETTIVDSLSNTLKVSQEEIEGETAFSEFGVDSILGVNFVDQINEQLGISLNMAVIFEHPSVFTLTRHVIATHKEAIEALLSRKTDQLTASMENDRHKMTTHTQSMDDVTSVEQVKPSEIAVIGMSGQCPKAADLETFWNNLIQGVDGIDEFPPTYLDPKNYSPEKQPGKTYCKWGGYVDERDCFDPLFFHMSPRDAESMNPHQRLVLQESWKAIEDAGYNPKDLSGSQTGIFIGAEPTGYFYESFTGSSDAIIASRLSYFLNLNGPALVVNTGCSSSGVALHLACESLRNRETDLALAGGVNACMEKDALIVLSEMEMLSATGRCHTFDKAADGTAFAEGVGIVLLKRLDDAIVDNDPIYGIICASGINQDGASNGITAPNGVAQEQLISNVYQKFQIDPEHISYIEAHGTGTKLGDPVEANALVRAFRKFTQKQAYCAIGSSKAHIGHAAAAAGVLGLIKVLLSIQHQQIPQLLHFNMLNPLIEFDGSPFYITTQKTDWKTPQGKPRMAALNSFGHSGTNAHLVIKEFIPPIDNLGVTNTTCPVLLVFSAKTEESLRQSIQAFVSFYRRQQGLSLADIAYTLQVGREAMPYRTVFLVEHPSQLLNQLTAFLNDEPAAKNCWSGYVESKRSSLLASDEDAKELVQQWIKKGKLSKIAESWCQNVSIDWELLYQDIKPKRVHLPSYPFAKERYWKPNKETSMGERNIVSTLHPLVHENTSTLFEQRFTSTFTGDEFFLADHQLGGNKVLPGVSYLEMARFAAEKATQQSTVHLKHVVWMQPIVVNDAPQTVHVRLKETGEEMRQLQYEVYSTMAEPVIHSQGFVELIAGESQSSIDVTKLKSQMNLGVLSADQCYQTFKQNGLDYGTGFKGIQEIYMGENQALAKLSLPPSVQDTQDDYLLHPSLMDSALQASLGLILGAGPGVPFALDSLEILGSCTPQMYSWVRYSANTPTQKFDIDLFDEQGTVRVKMRGFSYRMPKTGNNAVKTSEHSFTELRSLAPIWKALTSAPSRRAESSMDDQLLLIGSDSTPLTWLQASYPNSRFLVLPPLATVETIQELLAKQSLVHLVWIAPSDEAVESMILNQEDGVLQLFRIIKALINLGYDIKPLAWSVITKKIQAVKPNDSVDPTHAGVFGLMGSVTKEFPHWNIHLLDLDSLASVSAEACLSLAWDKQGRGLAYRDGEWFQQAFAQVSNYNPDTERYRTNGVYVVIGGAGGIGEVWSEYMIKRYQANIVWIGRREKDASIDQKINALAERYQQSPRYISADASRFEALQEALDQIRAIYPTIHGVVHSAIVLQDHSLGNMDEAMFRAGLSAKIDVSVNMERVFGSLALDFMLFFSSIQSFGRAAGQSNYAAGCMFKDSFAQMLRHRFAVKIMNWGYWGSVGIVKDISFNQSMERIGFGSIEPDEGMESLQNLVNSRLNQVALLKVVQPQADQVKLLELFNAQETLACFPQNKDSLLQRIHLPDSPQQLATQEMDPHAMDSLLTDFLISIFDSVGLFKPGVSCISDLSLETAPAPFYDRWLDTCIDFLDQQKLLSPERTFTKAVRPLSEVWDEWEHQKAGWINNSSQQAQVLLLETCLKALPDILTGKRLATSVMFPNSSMKLVEGIYKGNPVADYFNEVLCNTLVEGIRQLVQTNATIRILEIGAGTGGTTAKLLPKLQPFSDNIAEYRYTDLSKAFLMHAEEHYQPDFPALSTAIFDVSKPVAEQSIALNHYDFVVSTNCLHATPNIRETLRNAKATLKHQGVLLLNEVNGWFLFGHLTFGLLEGWWLYEDGALRLNGSPALSPESWQSVLEEEGFESVFFPAQNAHKFGQQIIVASSNGIVRQKTDTDTLLRMTKPAPQSTRAFSKPSQPAKKVGLNPPMNPSADIKRAQGAEVTDQMLQEFVKEALKNSVADALRMQHQKIKERQPFSEIGVDSIVAVQLINEINKKLNLLLQTTVLFDYNTIHELVTFILAEHGDIVRLSLQAKQATQLAKPPTVSEAPTKSPRPQIARVAPASGTVFQRVLIHGPGDIQDVTIETASMQGLKPTEVAVSVRAFSLNFGDLLCIRGLYPNMPPYPFSPGVEASGVISDIGSAVTTVSVGDEVIVAAGPLLGAHATAMICDQTNVFIKPPSMSFEEACALPAVSITMIEAFKKAQLQRNESILIQTATGGTGLIAVQLAKHYGATIYATAGSDHKVDYLKSLGIPFCINYEKQDFEMEIKRLTQNVGVDVVINTLAGDAIQKGMNCLAPGGRYIEIAMTALKSAKSIDLSVLSHNQSFFSIDMGRLGLKAPHKATEYRQEMLELYKQGIISPTICKTVPFEAVQDAYHALADRATIGKIVVWIPEHLSKKNPGQKNRFFKYRADGR